MEIFGRDNLWYLVPELGSGTYNPLLEESLEDGFLFGKTIGYTNVSGRLSIEVLGDLDWACEVATYLDLLIRLGGQRAH